MATRKTASTSGKGIRPAPVTKRGNRGTAPPHKAAKKKALKKEALKNQVKSTRQSGFLKAYGLPALALHGVPLIDTGRMALAVGDSGERRMSVKLTYAEGAEGALLSVYVYNRAAKRSTGNGIAITLNPDGTGEFIGAAGQTYRITCWFSGVLGSSIKLVVSYPASMHIDEPAAQLSPTDTTITDPTLGFNQVRLIVPTQGGLR
jgi:hypothetical protein